MIHRGARGSRDWSDVLERSAKEHRTRPAVDPLFTSAARAYGARVVGIALTGGGHDGMAGLVSITTAGGISLVQDPSEAEHPSMAEYAIAHDHVNAALTIDELGDVLPRLAHGLVVAVGIRPKDAPRSRPAVTAIANPPPTVTRGDAPKIGAPPK